jgi:hypothetical protein
MPKVTIAGIPGVDGEYLLDLDDQFTNRELHLIKQLSGVRAGEVGEAFAAGDNDLIVALTLIALKRAGREVSVDLIWDAKAGGVTFEQTDEEKAAQEEANALPPKLGLIASEDSNSAKEPSGSSLSTGSENQESVQSPSGSPRSGIGSISDPPTLVR